MADAQTSPSEASDEHHAPSDALRNITYVDVEDDADHDVPLLDFAGREQRRHRDYDEDDTAWLSQFAQRSRALRWLDGPHPRDELSVKGIRTTPFTILPSHNSKQVMWRWCLRSGIVWFTLWLLAFISIHTIYNNTLVMGHLPVRLDCKSSLWTNATHCSIDGENCQPFDKTYFLFRCPSNCASEPSQVLETHTVGDQEIIYDTMVIGGPVVYRADSFICQAAIHAELFGNARGGCGVLDRAGSRPSYPASISGGISSISFPSTFPSSYILGPTRDKCENPEWLLFTISVLATTLIATSPISSGAFITFISTIVFFQVALASDAPFTVDTSSAVSLAFRRALPLCFIVYVYWWFCIRRTLGTSYNPIERAILWMGGCWVGALNNYTFDRLPISRLTPHDLNQQPGAITTLVVILAVLTLIVVQQVLAFRKEGRLLKYLGFYLVTAVFLVCIAMIPGLQFRLHHYILAILLLPGTAVQTRPSFLYQGLLVGLLVNGIAKWGFDSILQTADALRQDGPLGSALPALGQPVEISSQRISFVIEQIAKGFDGISVLINDVERFQASQVPLPFTFNWTRHIPDEPIFVRMAYTTQLPLGGVMHGDFTRTGTWFRNGTWKEPLTGPSK